MKKFIIKLIYFSEWIIPQKKQIIFNSFPDYSDNSYALFKYCIEKKINYKLIWIVNDKTKIKNIKNKINQKFSEDIEVIYSKSARALWCYMRSKFIFSTHDLFTSISSEKIKKINLWHGMPLKAIKNLDKRKKIEIKSNYDTIIATSEFFQKIMAESFNVSKDKVLILGQPRNDLLFKETHFFNKVGLKREKYSKKIMWMPTFRKSLIKNKSWSNDGIYTEEKIGVISLDQLDNLNNMLKEKNILLMIKLHPMDFLQNIKIENKSNILIIKNQDLENIDEQLYPLLGNCDALITDFSSVWIDYEILNKPIYFVIEDYEDYKKTRGIVFDDFAEISSLPIIEKYEDFPKIIDDLLNCKIDKESSFKYNKYKDNRSCERIVKALNL